jgi:Ferritin-like domain
VTSPTPPQPRSRRALLVGAASAAGAAALAGCGGKPLKEKIRSGASVPKQDVPTLNALLDVENFGIAAYASAMPLLGSGAATACKWLLGQELAHAAELTELIKKGGGIPHKPAASYDLGYPKNADQAVALLERTEDLQLRAYLRLIPQLSEGHVRAAVATISANDAQHLAVLRASAGKPPTSAFVAG